MAVIADANSGVRHIASSDPPPPYTSATARAEIANVKALVEKILWQEQKGRELP